jgi:hypothetical protein
VRFRVFFVLLRTTFCGRRRRFQLLLLLPKTAMTMPDAPAGLGY